MAVTINGTTGISKVQDNVIMSSNIVDGSITNTDLATPYRMVQGTAVNASGTYVDFIGIPSWAKRITVMFDGVSTNGTSNYLIQIGNGSIINTGYNSGSTNVSVQTANTTSATAGTNGFQVYVANASATCVGAVTIMNISGFVYTSTHTVFNGANNMANGAGIVTLSSVMDRVRITTVNGTDTFDAGTINIMWEG